MRTVSADCFVWHNHVVFLPQKSTHGTISTNVLQRPASYTWPEIHLRGRHNLAIQGQYFSELECSLSSDMARMSHFCRQWRLKPSASKTISSVFHRHNTSATRELSVYLDGLRLRHECHPTYLGVTLDRMLSYREHLTKTAGKLKNRNNLLMKLAGSTWGSSANTLRSSALALCYSAAEYCFPVWSRSAHTSQVEVQLNSTMRLIYLVPSVLHLSHGFQPYEGRLPLTSWPIQPDILSTPLLRLTSSKPLWLDLQPVVIKSRWRHNWKSAQVVNSHLVCDLTIRQPGFDFPRQQWFLLNRFRTEQGTGNGDLQTLICGPCGETQTMSHIVESCSLTKLNGGLSWLHSADEDAVSWLSSYGL